MGTLSKQEKRRVRHRRVRAVIKGTAERPRISMFRSDRHLWAQVINDKEGKTVFALSDRNVSKKGEHATVALGIKMGAMLAEKAKEAGITRAVFDRGGYRYHGMVRAVAEGARKGGLVL